MAGVISPALDWGAAAAAMPNEDVSGDLHVLTREGERVLVGVIDGLGHGQDAASASRIAAAVLEDHPREPPEALIERSHSALRGTRGVVMSVASLDLGRNELSWAGVGNVLGVLLRGTPRAGDEELMMRAGIVGVQLPRVQSALLQVTRGDTLVFATDGVESGFGREAARHLPPQAAADVVLARHRKLTDDALVVVVRFLRDLR